MHNSVARILDALTVLCPLFTIPSHLVGSENYHFATFFKRIMCFRRPAQMGAHSIVHFACKITAW